MNAALTGGTGFVGSHLAEALRARGDAVTCLVRARTSAAPLQALGCRCLTGDLEDARALAELVEGTDVVFHVAGLVAAPSEDAFLRANRDGTARLAAAAREARVGRLLYVSSLSVTGPTTPGRPLDEGGPPRPVTAYGRSKQAGEEAVRAAGVPFTIVRPPVVYGPRDRQVLRVFRMARRGLAPLLGGGGQELSLVHGRDLAGALVAAATAGATMGRTYHAGHAAPVSQRALVAAIGAALGRRVRTIALPPAVVRAALVLSRATVHFHGRATLLDPAKADELLAPAWTCTSEALARDAGWRATTALDVGLRETGQWYREAGWL
jgi:dihydroflavonol-4-reductase